MSEEKSNFIRHIIDADLEGGKHNYVATRFPPEPNGYLHIGHAKSICLNFGLAQQYQSQNARCHLRFDDTNPATEDTEYVDSIKADVAWLGFDWGEHLYFASDYFDKMYELAEHLIKKGKAYVDSLSKDEIREYRGALGEPGRPSPYRDRSVEENLELFRKMKAGEFKDGEVVLRAKIDMESPNMIMRDPLLYRVRHETHHRTGDDWCIYPMYDYAHCLEDAIEGITHSICTLEFENNRELYDWVIAETEIQPVPKQYEFARLNLNYTVMSKRKLRQLVEDGDVDGWDDPRMPTIAGLRRRGVTAESIRNFCDMIGVAKANSMVDFQLFEFAIRDDLNHKAPRVMGVLDPLKLTITNYEGDGEELTISHWPHDVPNEGDRQVPFSKNLFVERSDFLEEPPKKWRRLSPGAEVRLRRAYVIKVDEVVKDDAGNVTELLCTYFPETKSGSDTSGKKVKGVIHWVSADKGVPAEVRIYDRLFGVERPDSLDADYKTLLNPESLIVKNAVLEPSAISAPEGTRFQFERHGYFWRDPESDGVVFNRIVALKDSWTKTEEKQSDAPQKVAEPKATNPEKSDSKRPKNYHRIVAREEDSVLQERYEKLQADGISEKQADVLSGDRGVSDFFESFDDNVDSKKAAAWVVNTMLPALDDDAFDSPKFDANSIATLLKRVDDGDITSAGSKTVFEKLRDDGGDIDTLIADLGLAKISDAGAIQSLVDEVFAENPKQLETYRGGKESLFGFFVGQVMKKTGGSADASVVQEVLRNSL